MGINSISFASNEERETIMTLEAQTLAWDALANLCDAYRKTLDKK